MKLHSPNQAGDADSNTLRARNRRHSGRSIARFAFLALALAATPGCGPRGSSGGGGGKGTADSGGQTLRYPVTLEPFTFDPALVTEGGTGDILQNIYEGLVQYDEEGRITGQLAQRWEVSRDGLTYTFHLRPRAAFQTGRPATAADVKYSLERALRPETRSGHAISYLGEIAGAPELAAGTAKDLRGVEAVDDHIVRIRLRRPRGYFLGALAYSTGFVVCREAIERNGGIIDERAAIGTGPFKLAEYRHGAKVTLESSPTWDGPKPHLARIERRIVTDPATAHVMYENGEVDVVQVSASDLIRDEGNAALKDQIQVNTQASVLYLAMQQRLQPAFRDARVRQAIARAINRDELVRVAAPGIWQRADGLLPPGMPGANSVFRRIPFDPAAAKALLAQAGFPNGRGFPHLELVYPHDRPERAAAAQLIRDSLRNRLGIQVDLQEREPATFVADRRAEKMPFYLGAWDADYLDPQNFLSTLLRTGVRLNNFGYSNSRFDALVDQADAMTDQSARIKLYQQADQLAMDEVAVLPYAYPRTAWLVKPYVKGVRRNIMGLLPQTTTEVLPH